MRCETTRTVVQECALCASSAYDVEHASVCVNVVIGVLVVLCELHVIVRVHIISLVVHAVVGLTLGFIALVVVVVVFVVATLHGIFCIWRNTLYTFQHSHCTSVTILCRPFARVFFNLAMRIRALFRKSATTLGLVEQEFWRMPFFTKRIRASSCEVILAKQSKHSSTGTFASRTSGSRCISLRLPRRRARSRIPLCCFCTLIDIVTETATVSFSTLPVGFPIANNIQEFFVRRFFHNFRFWRQNS